MIWIKLINSLQKFKNFEQSIILIFEIDNAKLTQLACPSEIKNSLDINNPKFSSFLHQVSKKHKKEYDLHEYNDFIFSSYFYHYNNSNQHLILIGNINKENIAELDEFSHPAFEMIKYFMDAQLDESHHQKKAKNTGPLNNNLSTLNDPLINIYQTAFEQAHSAMALADMDGNIYDLNEKWVKMHSYHHKSELVNKNLEIFHTKEQFINDVIPVLSALKNKKYFYRRNWTYRQAWHYNPNTYDL